MPSPLSLSPITPLSSCAFRRTVPSTANVAHRRLHGSLIRAKNPTVSKNNLEKTLESHRSSNRTNLLRKVESSVSSRGLFRPDLPSEDLARHGPPQESSFSAPPRNTRLFRPMKRSRKEPVSSKRTSILRLRTSAAASGFDHVKPSKYLRWDAYEQGERPEQRPWLDHVDPVRKPCDATSRLDAEIRALERYLTPTQREQANVDQLVEDISSILKGIVPQPPRVIGSRRTGMAVSHSDVDFVLPVDDCETSSDKLRRPSATRPKLIDTYTEILRKAKHALQQNSMFNGRVYISGKRVPVLTATHGSTGLQLQFYCGQGLPSSIEYTRDYQAEYPTLRPLYMTTRLILETRSLFGTYESSLGSDALLMILVAFLKMNHGRFQRPDSLGEQLLAILQTYGTKINLETTGVSVDPPGFFNADTVKGEVEMIQDPETTMPAHLRGQRSFINLKRTAVVKRNYTVARRLCIQDPSNYMNDLGRPCTRTLELQNTFAAAYRRLRASLDTWTEESAGRSHPSILTHALKANFDDFEKIRARVAYFPAQCL